MLAVDVAYRIASGEATSAEKVLEHMTGRDRLGNRITGVTPTLECRTARRRGAP